MSTNILTALDAGSGIDSKAVIDGLAAAERAARVEPLKKRQDDLAARISALGQLRSAVQGLATSLNGRVRAGSLGLVPRSSETAVVAERFGAGPTTAFVADMSVTRLASAQRVAGPALAGPDAPVGQGRLTIAFGTRTALPGGGFDFVPGTRPPVEIEITPATDSLVALRDAINAAGAGLTATIVASGSDSRLTIRGPEGAANAFTIAAAPAAGDDGLMRFNDTPGDSRLTLSAAAGDAELVYDGIAVTRPTNSIDDLVAGVRLRLVRPAAGVRLEAARDPAEAAATVADLATALGALRDLIADLGRAPQGEEAGGVLARDSTRRVVDLRLARLVNDRVPAAGGLSLRDLGLSIARDGSFSLDASRVAALPPGRLGDVETLLRRLGSAGGDGGLPALAALIGPGLSGLEGQRSATQRDMARAEARLESYRAGLVRQFAVMDRLVATSRAVEAQLDQQIAMWTRRD